MLYDLYVPFTITLFDIENDMMTRRQRLNVLNAYYTLKMYSELSMAKRKARMCILYYYKHNTHMLEIRSDLLSI